MWYARKAQGASKFGNETKEYNGRIYHSKKEAGYAAELDLMIKAGMIKEWKPQFRLSLDIYNEKGERFHICNYVPDFLVTMPDGTQEIHEVKGFETPEWRFKWKLAEALYSHIYKMVVIK